MNTMFIVNMFHFIGAGKQIRVAMIAYISVSVDYLCSRHSARICNTELLYILIFIMPDSLANHIAACWYKKSSLLCIKQ